MQPGIGSGGLKGGKERGNTVRSMGVMRESQ